MPYTQIIPAVWELPDYFHKRIGERVGRQRAMVDNGWLLLVLHEPPKPDEKTRRPRLFCRKPDGEWLSTAPGNGKVAMQKHIEEYTRMLDELDARQDKATSGSELFAVTSALLPLKRSAANFLDALADARKLLPAAPELINFRDQAYDLSRNAELLFEDTRNAMELAQTRHAEEQARTSHAMAVSAHRLNRLAAFFFPLATLAGVFGMQLAMGFPATGSPLPFYIICGIGLLLGIVISTIVSRRP